MSYLTQKTIKDNVSFKGVALHSGVNVNICIKPADPNFGIVFQRVDLKTNNLIYPNFMNVTNTSLNTTIENENGVKVSTIEHLMGALFGLGIDNALIEIDISRPSLVISLTTGVNVTTSPVSATSGELETIPSTLNASSFSYFLKPSSPQESRKIVMIKFIIFFIKTLFRKFIIKKI